MTPRDFVRAILPGEQQPEGLGLDQFRIRDSVKSKAAAKDDVVDESSVFSKIGQNGLISFSDYLFLSTVLSSSPRQVEIAFKLFDLNGDGEVELDEFLRFSRVLATQTAIGKRHRDHSTSVDRGVNTALLDYLFPHRDKKLQVADFLAFQRQLSREVCQIEFNRRQPDSAGRIREGDFARMLMAHSTLPEKQQSKMIARVSKKFSKKRGRQGITFDQVCRFNSLLLHLTDFEAAFSYYNVTKGSAVDQNDFRRIAHVVADTNLDDHLLDVIFTLFDHNDDGKLSEREFIYTMKARKRQRGLTDAKDTGVARLIKSFWQCTLQEIRHH